jgi:hypothetical protein
MSGGIPVREYIRNELVKCRTLWNGSALVLFARASLSPVSPSFSSLPCALVSLPWVSLPPLPYKSSPHRSPPIVPLPQISGRLSRPCPARGARRGPTRVARPGHRLPPLSSPWLCTRPIGLPLSSSCHWLLASHYCRSVFLFSDMAAVVRSAGWCFFLLRPGCL